MKIKIYSNLFLCLLFFTFCVPYTLASDLTGSNFIIRDPVIGAGGGYATSGSFKLFQSIDPTLIGVGSSALYEGRYGFLYFPAPEDIVIPPDDGGGGGGGGIVNPIPGLEVDCKVVKADLNCDGTVDIFDLSIILYYLKHPESFSTFYDLRPDRKIDFADLSVLFYYWDED